MNIIQKIGLTLFVIALAIFTLSLGLDNYELNAESLQVKTQYHKDAIAAAAKSNGLWETSIGNNFEFVGKLKEAIKSAKASQDQLAGNGIPDGVGEWDTKLVIGK